MRKSGQLGPISFGRIVFIAFALAVFAVAFAASVDAQVPTSQQLRDWRKDMRQVPKPHPGCFSSAYPSRVWQEVPCTSAPRHPYPPARGPRPSQIGNGNDVSAEVGGSISEAVGSFDSVTGVTSETGTGPFAGPNSFSLQLNSNFFISSACNGAATPGNCQGWQQFVYANASCPNCGFMQYWLLGWGSTTCPAGWTYFNNFGDDECFTNSDAVSVPFQTVANLANLSLTGQANSGGNDTITISTGSNLYSIQNLDSVLFLAQGWQIAEFNIVGDCCGSQANFNSGSTLVVRTSVNYGNTNAPSCSGEGFTGETNSLSFAAAPAAKQETLPAVVFTESTAGGAASACASATAIPAMTVTLGDDKLAQTHDFNGDGNSDVLWRDGVGDVGMWLMNGGRVLQGAVFNSVPTNWSIVGQRDFDGDGKADILWRDTAGDVGLWLMNGTQIVQGGSFGAIPLSWSVAGTGDFNGDGKADILWVDNHGNVGIWFMNGTQILQASVVGQLPPNWIVVGSDMKADIFLRNISSGDVGMWVMHGAELAQAVDFGSVPLNWSVVGIGDFDGNGSFDLLWRDTAGDVAIWFLSGASISTTVTINNLPTSWSIVETGDYNGDGRSDILWVDNMGDVAAWLMNGNTIGSVVSYGNVGSNWLVQSRGAD